MSGAVERRVLADRLIELTETDLIAASPDWDRHPACEQQANVVLNVIRAVIGAAISEQPTDAAKQAFVMALAPRLGQPLGQLMRGLPHTHVSACLEGHAEIMGQALGATAFVAVKIHDTPPSKPQLKVVQ